MFVEPRALVWDHLWQWVMETLVKAGVPLPATPQGHLHTLYSSCGAPPSASPGTRCAAVLPVLCDSSWRAWGCVLGAPLTQAGWWEGWGMWGWAAGHPQGRSEWV